MRLTPSQIGMLNLLGEWLPFSMPDKPSLAELIKDGRKSLVNVAGTDFEYGLDAWHNHLRATNDGGYRWSNKHLGMPRRIARALADPEWQEAVAELRNQQ
jgi:hypothetical protein